MAVLCCCPSPRSSKRASPATVRGEAKDKQPALPTPPPPVRLPGPLTLNPVVAPSPEISPASMSSLHTSTLPTSLVPVEPVELGQLVVEDSDSDGEGETTSQNKNASTLQLVKTRIRRHLSQEALPRRKGRSAVGSSQEEIDRRAELKRLMHKRIQEELRNDEGDAAPSEGSSSHRSPGQAIDLPGGGPRDNLEFLVIEDTSQVDSKNPTSMEESDITESRARNVSLHYDENHHPEGRRASCPECNSPNTANGKKLLRERSSLPQMPSSPDLLPKRFPSISSSSSLGSWRLSYSAGQLDELLNSIDRDMSKNPSSQKLTNSPVTKASASKSPRMPFSGHSNSLSRSHSTPSRNGTPSNDTSSMLDQSPLGTWLRSQGLRSRSPSFSFIRTSEQINEPDFSVQKAEVVYLRRCSSVQNCAVAEADIPRPEVVHLYDMDIHRQLVTRALNTPNPSPSQSESGKNTLRVKSSRERASDKADVQGSGVLQETAKNEVPTNPSSVYPSGENSHGPSPGESSLNLPDPSAHWKNSLALLAPGSMWLGDPYKSHGARRHGSSSSPTAGENCPDSPATATQTKLPAVEVSPLPRDNPKPEIIEKTIHHFRLGHGAPATIVKRFYKQTEDTLTTAESHKPSLLERLHLAFPRKAKLGPRSFDGASSIDQRQMASYSLNLSTFGNPDRPPSRSSEQICRSRRSPDASGSSEGSTSGLWQRAVREEALNRKLVFHEADSHHRRLSLPDIGQPRKPYDEIDTASLRHRCSSPLGYSMVNSHGNGPFHPPATPISFLSVDRANTPSPYKSLPAHESGNRVPDAWARFPSHNRAERNGPAGHADRVITRDFGAQHASDSGSNASSPTQRSAKRESQISIPGRLGKAVKSGLSKLIPSRNSPNFGNPKPPPGRSQGGHAQHKGKLEYPEMELLPADGGHREINALRHEVRHLKEPPHIQCPVPVQQNVDSDGNKVTLNSKMATILHTDGASDNGSSAAPSWATPMSYPLPTTPGSMNGARLQRRGCSTTTTTGATERYATPPSAMSLGNSNENTSSSSFHSSSQLGPTSRSVRSPFPFSAADMRRLSEINRSTDTIVSAKSETAISIVRKIQRQLLNLSGATGAEDDSDAGEGSNSPGKFGTWSAGRSKTYPALPVAHTTTPERPVGRGAGRLWPSPVSLRAKVVVH